MSRIFSLEWIDSCMHAVLDQHFWYWVDLSVFSNKSPNSSYSYEVVQPVVDIAMRVALYKILYTVGELFLN